MFFSSGLQRFLSAPDLFVDSTFRKTAASQWTVTVYCFDVLSNRGLHIWNNLIHSNESSYYTVFLFNILLLNRSPCTCTDKNSWFKPVVDLSRHEENLQDAVEVTCGSLIVQAMMTSLWWSHLKDRKTQCHYTVNTLVLFVNLIWLISVFLHNVSDDGI